MKTKIIFYTLSFAKYLLTGTDIKHLYTHFYDKVETPILIFLGLLGVVAEILVLSPSVITTVSMKYRKNIQLGLHIGLAVNSLAWMIYDYTSIWNILFFLFAIGLNFSYVHRVLHAIHTES